MQKIDTLTSLVRAYAIKVERNSIPNKTKYIVTVLESGLRKAVAIIVRTAKLKKYAAIKIIK